MFCTAVEEHTSRVSPFAAILQGDEYVWGLHLFKDPNLPDFHRFCAMRTYLLTSYLYPDGIYERLLLANRWMVWGFLLDDVLGKGIFATDPESVQAYIAPIIAVLFDPEKPINRLDNPFASLFAQLWQQMLPFTTSIWRERCIQHHIDWLNSYSWESENRAQGIVPNQKCYRAMRLVTAATYVTADLLEFCTLTELSAEVYESSACQRLLRHALGAMCWDNDLVSWLKEEAAGDVHNLILITQREHDCTYQEAVKHINELIGTELKQSIQAGEQLLEQFPFQWWGLQRYITWIQSMVVGARRWYRASERYILS